MDFIYKDDKNSCWYKNICDNSKCDSSTFCTRHYKMSYLLDAATLVGNQRYPVELKPDKVDLEAYKHLRDIKNDINNFVKSGKNILIYSNNTGNGKTEWSKKLLLSWFNSIWPTTDLECRGLFISMPKFIYALKDNISNNNEYFKYVNENVIEADLVVWDELNYKEWSQYEQDYMLNILSQRLAIGKSNIYTTNYTLDAIESRLGSRLASRVIGGSDCVEFKGTDKRGLKR